MQPLYFRQVDGPFGMLFREDERGHITSVVTDLMPQYASVKLDWYATPGFHIGLLQGFALMFLTVVPAAAIRFVQNRRLSDDRKVVPRGARIAYWIIVGICVANLLLVAGTFQWVMQPSELHSPLLIYKIVLGLGPLSAALTIGALVYSALAWRKRYWGIVTRGYYTLMTVAAVGFIWFLNYWNLFGWRY
jgi:hypothetical protein